MLENPRSNGDRNHKSATVHSLVSDDSFSLKKNDFLILPQMCLFKKYIKKSSCSFLQLTLADSILANRQCLPS